MRFERKDRPQPLRFVDDITASVKRDFQRPNYLRHKSEREQPQNGAVRRIAFIGEQSSYYKYRNFLLGKAVRIIKPGYECGVECEFIHEEDREALNKAAGWSDAKITYLLDTVKFK